jgi:hypothetical protein
MHNCAFVYCRCWLEFCAEILLSQHLFVICVGTAEVFEDAGILLQLELAILLYFLKDSHLLDVVSCLGRLVLLDIWFCSSQNFSRVRKAGSLV